METFPRESGKVGMNLVMTMAMMGGALLAQMNPPGKTPRPHGPGMNLQVTGIDAQRKPCSIPLLNVLPAPRNYRIVVVPPPAGAAVEHMPEVQVPAPACLPGPRVR